MRSNRSASQIWKFHPYSPTTPTLGANFEACYTHILDCAECAAAAAAAGCLFPDQQTKRRMDEGAFSFRACLFCIYKIAGGCFKFIYLAPTHTKSDGRRRSAQNINKIFNIPSVKAKKQRLTSL
jgi:hypothetical protein